MQCLNLPIYNFRITTKGDRKFIFDQIRKKDILLTPEEWVRQHIINFLLEDLSYPKGLIKVESSVKYNERMKRSDVVVYSGLGKPSILVECKAPSVKIDQATLEQVAMYNRTLKAEIMVLTNGLMHYTFKVGEKGDLVSLPEIPKFERL